MSEMGVSIFSDGVGKPFSVRPAADDDLICQNELIRGKICFMLTNVRHPQDVFLLLRINLPQDFQENIFGGASLVYNRYSEQSV